MSYYTSSFTFAEAFKKMWIIIHIKYYRDLAEWKEEYRYNTTGLQEFIIIAEQIVSCVLVPEKVNFQSFNILTKSIFFIPKIKSLQVLVK